MYVMSMKRAIVSSVASICEDETLDKTHSQFCMHTYIIMYSSEFIISICSTSELVNYIFLWVPTHIGLSYTSNYRYTNVNLVPTI